jgi:ubiquinone/menaquinone biosynthesis C-methylase UbiE
MALTCFDPNAPKKPEANFCKFGSGHDDARISGGHVATKTYKQFAPEPRGPGRGVWVEVGCGTGALSATVQAQCSPKRLIPIDLSECFVARARVLLMDDKPRAYI